MPVQLEQLRYVRLPTRDLAAATRFATDILGLQHVGTVGGCAYFRSDFRDHTLCYVAGDDDEAVFAIDVRTPKALEEAWELLTARGCAPRRGTAAEAVVRKVKAFIAFRDHSGNLVELVLRPLMSGWRYFPSRDAGIRGLHSVALRTTHPEDDAELWTGVFGASVTDWIGDGAYLTWDASHHRVAIHPATRSGILSIAYAVESIDQIMQSQYFLRNAQVRISHGPGRNPASEQIFVTFQGPDDMLFSFVTLPQAAPDQRGPRQFPDHPSSFCAWGSDSHIPELGGAQVQ